MFAMVKIVFIFFVGVTALFLTSSVSQADMKQMKIYKEAFPEAKVKCIDCHTDAMPKKDDGKHEVNDYSKAVLAEAAAEAAQKEAEPTAESYKKIGKIEEFKK